MTDQAKDQADIEAEELLPCIFKGGLTKKECPSEEISMICNTCAARPAVAAKLRERDVEIDALKHDVGRLIEIALIEATGAFELEAQLAAANSEIERLENKLFDKLG